MPPNFIAIPVLALVRSVFYANHKLAQTVRVRQNGIARANFAVRFR
jgi:hypothetical protein